MGGIIEQARPEDGSATRHIGVIASGGDVIASKKIAIYRKDWPKLIGVEMEGGGMAEGLHDDIKRPRFLMIRGVSDLANGGNNAEMKERWRSYACHVAAAYAIGCCGMGLSGRVVEARRPAATYRTSSTIPLHRSATRAGELAARKQCDAGQQCHAPADA